MNRGERATLTKHAKEAAMMSERNAVKQLIQKHRHMIRAMADGPTKEVSVTLLNALEEQIVWGWHREGASW